MARRALAAMLAPDSVYVLVTEVMKRSFHPARSCVLPVLFQISTNRSPSEMMPFLLRSVTGRGQISASTMSGIGVGVGVGVDVSTGVAVGVLVGVRVGTGVLVGVGVAPVVGVAVCVGVCVGVAVGVGDGVPVGVLVGVGVGGPGSSIRSPYPSAWFHVYSPLQMSCPSFSPPSSSSHRPRLKPSTLPAEKAPASKLACGMATSMT